MNEHTIKKHSIVLLTASSVFFLSSCSMIKKRVGNTINYKNSTSMSALEIPPDLTKPEYDDEFSIASTGIINTSTFEGRNKKNIHSISVLPNVGGIKVKHEGNNVRYLEVAQAAGVLWPKFREFWQALGVKLKKDSPRIGIMKTDWAENRADLPMGWLRNTLGKVFQNTFDAGYRDRYRLRVEKVTANLTRVYITHRGAELVVTDTGSRWEMRPKNPELEAEVLNRLMMYLQTGQISGVTKTKTRVKKTSVSKVTSTVILSSINRQPILSILGDTQRIWIRTGVMLERMGMRIERQNPQHGIFTVSYIGERKPKKQSIFSKMFKRNKNNLITKGTQYQIYLQNITGGRTALTVFDVNGKKLKIKPTNYILQRLKIEFDR